MESELNPQAMTDEDTIPKKRMRSPLDEWNTEMAGNPQASSISQSPENAIEPQETANSEAAQKPDHKSIEDAILRERVSIRKAKWYAERAIGLRVYNYFRIVLSFLLFIIFYEFPNQTFIGSLEPQWFQNTMFIYLMFNVAFGFAVLVNRKASLTGTTVIVSVALLDIIILSVLLLTSGGIDSGLGYLLVFAVSFGSVMITNKNSLIFPAVATATCIAVELNLHIQGIATGSQHFFQVSLLGTSFFMVNFFFQSVSKRLAESELEVVGLETLDRMHQMAERARQELEVSNARFSVLLTSTAEGVVGLDMKGKVTFANPRACQLLDIQYEDLINTDIQRFMIPTDDAVETESLRKTPPNILELLDIETKQTYHSTRWQTSRNVSFNIDYSFEETVNKAGLRTGAVLLLQNLTQQRENEERIKYLANYDALTGLANRTSFLEVLKMAMLRTGRTERSLAILVVDIDHLTVVNEKMGQETGDELLRIVSQRLKSAIREGDMVARLHSDQFGIMLVDLEQAENAGIVADHIITAATEPMDIFGNDVRTSVSVGIAVMNGDHHNSDNLISAGMSAVDNAKEEGRNTYCFFHPDMQKRAEEKKRVQMLLRTATDNNEFEMVYQPIISLEHGTIQSCEALIRWFPNNSEPIRPDIFIPIAEESGQISKIGSWVLSEVSQQVKYWKNELGMYPTIAINVSTKQLRNSDFREQFQKVTERYDIPVQAMELELTETGMMENPERCMKELIKLREIGVSISIDDFGTGYSSLDYLRRLPLDVLKIDMTFTSGIGVSPNDEEMVRVMIRMAHAMGLKVICEGVETKEQLDFLRKHDCDLVQGYYLSKPRSVKDITDLFIRERNGTINIIAGEAG